MTDFGKNSRIYSINNGQRTVYVKSPTQARSAFNALIKLGAWAAGTVEVCSHLIMPHTAQANLCHALNRNGKWEYDREVLYSGKATGTDEPSPTLESSLRLMGLKPISEGDE